MRLARLHHIGFARSSPVSVIRLPTSGSALRNPGLGRCPMRTVRHSDLSSSSSSPRCSMMNSGGIVSPSLSTPVGGVPCPAILAHRTPLTTHSRAPVLKDPLDTTFKVVRWPPVKPLPDLGGIAQQEGFVSSSQPPRVHPDPHADCRERNHEVKQASHPHGTPRSKVVRFAGFATQRQVC